MSFSSALAQKDVKKDIESLIPEEEDKVSSRKWPHNSGEKQPLTAQNRRSFDKHLITFP